MGQTGALRQSLWNPGFARVERLQGVKESHFCRVKHQAHLSFTQFCPGWTLKG